MLWVLNQSDGTHSLLDIAERSGLAFDIIKDAADMLLRARFAEAMPGEWASGTHPA